MDNTLGIRDVDAKVNDLATGWFSQHACLPFAFPLPAKQRAGSRPVYFE
jgi:hypothetical protein